MRRTLRLIALLMGTALPAIFPAQAQDRATLVADSLSITSSDTLTARGHVEVFFQGVTLTATGIVYDQSNDRLIIDGPIVLTDGKGSVILASQAEMRADLTEGLLTSARMVLQQQLQLAAAEIQRVDGRYTSMSKVVASSCKVCAGNPTPLWEIRASRVVHDEVAQQLYFDSAQLRLAGGAGVLYSAVADARPKFGPRVRVLDADDPHKFQLWHRVETARILLKLAIIVT